MIVGVIDSGIGGLTMLKALNKKYGNLNYIYLADNLNMPYGNKSTKFVKTRLLELVNYLHNTFNVGLVIIACNTASLTALEYVKKHSLITVLGLNPTNQAVEDCTMLCTKLSSKNCNKVPSIVCSKLAGVIEDNILTPSLLKKKLKNILTKLNIKQNNIILGCTHYELIKDIFIELEPSKNFILPCQQFVDELNLDLINTIKKSEFQNNKGALEEKDPSLSGSAGTGQDDKGWCLCRKDPSLLCVGGEAQDGIRKIRNKKEAIKVGDGVIKILRRVSLGSTLRMTCGEKFYESSLMGTRGDVLMLSTLPTKTYIDKLWQIYKSN